MDDDWSTWEWLIHMKHDSFTWDLTHSHGTWLFLIKHDSFTWMMTYSSEQPNSHISTTAAPWDMTWLVHTKHDWFTWDMTHSHETWLIHVFIWDMIQYERSYQTRLIHMGYDLFICDMTPSHGTCIPSIIFTRDMTHPNDSFYARHDTFVPAIICCNVNNVTHAYSESYLGAMWPIPTCNHTPIWAHGRGAHDSLTPDMTQSHTWDMCQLYTWEITQLHTWEMTQLYTWKMTQSHTWEISQLNIWKMTQSHTWEIPQSHTWDITQPHHIHEK